MSLPVPRRRSLPLIALLVALGAATWVEAAPKYKLETLQEEAPQEVSMAVRKQLAPEAARVVSRRGKPLVDWWPAKSVATDGASTSAEVHFGRIPLGAFVGVLRVHERSKDFKGGRYSEGVYTCRYGVRPADGDHQGVSDTRDFLLLSPAKLDVALEPKELEELVELSKKSSKGGHPTILYLRPGKSDAKDSPLPRLLEDEGSDQWLIECKIPSAGDGKPPAHFRLVVLGVSPGA